MSWFSNWRLASELKDPSSLVREEAVRTIGKQADPANLKRLAPLLADNVEGVRRAAVEAVVLSGDPKGMASLFPLLENAKESPDVQKAVLKGLQALAAVDPAPLWTYVRDKDRPARGEVVHLLALLNTQPHREVLVELAADADRRVAKEAIYALGALRCGAGAAAIANVLNAPGTRWLMRAEAAAALGRIGDSNSLPSLLQRLNDPHDVVRLELCEALAGFDDSRVWPALKTLLSDACPLVRARTCAQLGVRGRAESVGLLLEAVGKPEDATEAVRALEAAVRACVETLPDDLVAKLCDLPDVAGIEFSLPDDVAPNPCALKTADWIQKPIVVSCEAVRILAQRQRQARSHVLF